MVKRTRKATSTISTIGLYLAATGCIAALVLAALLIYGLKNVERPILEAWAGIATILLPPAILVGWLVGTYGSRRESAGIDIGISKIVKAAASMIHLRGQTATTMRRATATVPTPGQPVPPLDLRVVDGGATYTVEEFEVGAGSHLIEA